MSKNVMKVKRGTTDSWRLGPELVHFTKLPVKDRDSVIRCTDTMVELYAYTNSAESFPIGMGGSGGSEPQYSEGKIPGLWINTHEIVDENGNEYPNTGSSNNYCTKIRLEAPADCFFGYMDDSGAVTTPIQPGVTFEEISNINGSCLHNRVWVCWPAETVGVKEPLPIKIYMSIREVNAYEELEEGQLGLEYTEDGQVKLKAGMPGMSKWDELPYIGDSVASDNVVVVTYDTDTNLCSHSAEEVNEMIDEGKVPVLFYLGKMWYPGDACITAGETDRHFWHYDCDNQFIQWGSLKPTKAFQSRGSLNFMQMKDTIGELSSHVTNIMGGLDELENMVSVSYSELSNLRNEEALIPGRFYRITDYKCYASAEEAQALNTIDFDIIVQALDSSQLSEHAQAAPKTASKIIVSPDVIESEGRLIEDAVEFIYQAYVDDGSEYSGLEEHTKIDDAFIAYEYLENNIGETVPVLYKTDRRGLPSAGEDYDEEFAEPDWDDIFYYVGRATIDSEEYDKWQKIDTDYNWETPQKFVYTNVVTSYEARPSYKFSAWELKYCLDNDTSRFEWANESDGTGVIYYMKDEWGNEAPYDFKNIVLDINGIESYTFSTSGDADGTEDGFFQDCVVNTLKGNNGILKLPHCGVRASERQSNVVFGKDCENVSLNIQVEGIPSIQLDPGIQDEHITISPEHNMAGKNLIVRAPNTQEILL